MSKQTKKDRNGGANKSVYGNNGGNSRTHENRRERWRGHICSELTRIRTRKLDSYVRPEWIAEVYGRPSEDVILDALCGYSVDTVAKAYYDVVLQYQKLRSDDDTEMLKIIFDNIGSDLGSVYSIGKLSTLLSNLVKQPVGTVTSSYQAAEGAAQSDIQTLIDAFSN